MRIWRSLDLLVTAAVALIVGVLGMLDLARASVVSAATLATLAILAAGALADRVQMNELARAVKDPAAGELLTVSTSGLGADLAGAADIGIIGVTLNRTVRNHTAALTDCVRRGGTVRIAIIDQHESVVGEAARRSTTPDAAEIFAHRRRPTLDIAGALTALPGPGRVEVRLLDFVPAFGLLAVDAGQRHGRLHVDFYSHTLGGREPTLALHAGRDHAWFQHFLAEFEVIWAAGRPSHFVSGRHFN